MFHHIFGLDKSSTVANQRPPYGPYPPTTRNARFRITTTDRGDTGEHRGVGQVSGIYRTAHQDTIMGFFETLRRAFSPEINEPEKSVCEEHDKVETKLLELEKKSAERLQQVVNQALERLK